MSKLLHICEVCVKEVFLTPEEAYQAGWDYPPRMGSFGLVGPRTCESCTVEKTLWWALAMDRTPPEELSEAQQRTLERILREPESLLPAAKAGGAS